MTSNKQTIDQLITDLNDARQRTLELVKGLDAQQLMGPKLDTINPLLWEIGHVAYFYEYWILRHLDGNNSFLDNADELYDSINIAHNTRWDLPLLSLDETLSYMQQVKEAVINRLDENNLSDDDIYLTSYALFHEDMHTEAFTYSRITLDYPKPEFAEQQTINIEHEEKIIAEDALVPAQQYQLGAEKGALETARSFCFDNEKWSHPVEIKAFHISKTATSNQQFLEFVEAGGYQNKQYWDEDAWQWLSQRQLTAPVYWRKGETGNWQQKCFDHWVALDKNAAVIHVSWYEATAWCRWAKRRLPTEAEWELAASGPNKKTYPWGDEMPNETLANMDAYQQGTINVSALPLSDSQYGCRQMIGNVWEWTADTFNPFAQFTADMYADYSQPLFGQTKVLRGGAWTTRSRMIRNTWRNYYAPDRNDVFAGFRSCAID